MEEWADFLAGVEPAVADNVIELRHRERLATA
jgi:hypothetical protein